MSNAPGKPVSFSRPKVGYFSNRPRMYICMYVRIYVCLYVCMFICMYVYMYVCCLYVRMYVCMFVCMYVYMYVCLYICMYVCIYVCVCMYVCVVMFVSSSVSRSFPCTCLPSKKSYEMSTNNILVPSKEDAIVYRPHWHLRPWSSICVLIIRPFITSLCIYLIM